MKKISVVPVIVTAAISVAVLFGGWTIYNQVAVAAPLEDAIADVPGIVNSAKPKMSKDQVTIDVTLSQDANLREIYQSINHNGKGAIGSRELKLDVLNESNKVLDDYWYQALFEVAEAMENKAYSNIPKALEEAGQDNPAIQAETEMDDNNIYITLKTDNAVKFIVLPRTPAQMGVWENA
ncbi:hypothetical protein [Paenibacillus sp. YIM B09110]|uniref:hypothetical protein n=1 Tax=Paenibacillus sp. YIM B09110 TaxID=3126102 RepID=UPI00301E4431